MDLDGLMMIVSRHSMDGESTGVLISHLDIEHEIVIITFDLDQAAALEWMNMTSRLWCQHSPLCEVDL